ncbi:electron transport complex subunit RsxC [Ruminococcaceae bacterium OttesenSCG-928-I18]|nr:electron transport complex subunit RsxC [Ruminococcaceae bacterium OttesenSCG-928-I18]
MVRKLRAVSQGASVPHRKNTSGQSTERMPVPKQVTLMMQQHIGAPAKPVVKKGDEVLVGQMVGEAGGFVSSPVYSGVSGKVKALEQVVAANGALVEAVVIETDGQQTLSGDVAVPQVHNRESFLEAVRACGLVGLGGAGFPTAVKLSPKELDKIDILLINGAECEPYITSDEQEILENSGDILSGIAAVQKYLGIERAVIGIERNKPEAMDLLFSLTKGKAGIEVHPLPSKYPQGAEKVLIEQVTGRQVPAGGLPSDVGVIVLNVTTAGTLGRYLSTGMPLVTKRLTVDGGAVAQPKNVEVILGTSVAEVIEFCGGYKEPPGKLLMGGPMMGVALPGDGYPVMKQNNAILALSAAEAALPEEGPCIRCGRCIASCPMSLSPTETEEAYKNRDLDRLKKLNADVCIACGVCSYVCPAKRYVSQHANLARGYLLKEVAKERGKS